MIKKSKDKALIFRASKAFGDTIFISFVPKKLKERGYKNVTIALWASTAFVFENNPYVDEIIIIDDFGDESFEAKKAEWKKEYDFFDFRYTVEYNYFDKSHQPEFDVCKRRKRAKGINYYRDGLKAYGLSADKGELYLSDEEKTIIAKYKNQGRKRILWQVAGSGKNKILTYVGSYINAIAEKNPDIDHFICGDFRSAFSNIKAEITDVRGQWNPRKTLSMIPTFDLVVGPESFVVNAAGALDIPSMCFYSHSAPENLGVGFKYHYPIVPICECHPCYLLISDFRTVLDLKQREIARNQEKYCLYRNQKNTNRGVAFRCCHDIDHKSVIDKIVDLMK